MIWIACTVVYMGYVILRSWYLFNTGDEKCSHISDIFSVGLICLMSKCKKCGKCSFVEFP